MSTHSRYTPEQLRHLHVNLEQNAAFTTMARPSSECAYDDIFYGKFKSIIRILYQSQNPVSLCNDVIESLSESVSPDVANFVNNWLRKSFPVIQGCPDDDVAFDMIVPRSVQSVEELRPYIETLTGWFDEHQALQTPKTDPS